MNSESTQLEKLTIPKSMKIGAFPIEGFRKMRECDVKVTPSYGRPSFRTDWWRIQKQGRKFVRKSNRTCLICQILTLYIFLIWKSGNFEIWIWKFDQFTCRKCWTMMTDPDLHLAGFWPNSLPHLRICGCFSQSPCESYKMIRPPIESQIQFQFCSIFFWISCPI